MVKLSKRLLVLAGLVPAGMRVADIGTDHGFLPCYLVENGIAPFAVGVEVKVGPYLSACRTLEEHRLGKEVEIRQGDGLQPLEPGEVDVVVIAGMGGSTMKDILTRSPRVAGQLKRLILQPMNRSDLIRAWLHGNGWQIIAEDLIPEERRLYEVIVAEPGLAPILGETEACYGPLLIQNRHPLLRERLQKDERAMQEILTQLAKSKCRKAKRRVEEFKRKLRLLKELEEWLFAARPS